MPSINEISGEPTQLNGALLDGLANLDLNATVTFQTYVRVVLPIDGYVFWNPTVPLTVSGSLHYSQDIVQSEDELYANATVVFTTSSKITEFSGSDRKIYVAATAAFRYAFSQQQGFYSQAGLWHYFGHSIAPAMAAQLLDNPASINPNEAVVSNSLPLWLALNDYVCPYYDGFSNDITLYPSFLTKPNIAPPYATVHIGENDTRAVSTAPLITRHRNHYQPCIDKVRIILYGLQNNDAMDFVDCVNQYTLDVGTFGIVNMPVMRDAKRNQTELLAIAMKKVIEYEVYYEQERVSDIARQLIEKCVPNYLIESVVNPVFIGI